MSVKETAFSLGYKDQFFFSKQFHQKLGYPPSAINPLNPRGVRRYQPKDVPAEPEPVSVTPPPQVKASAKRIKTDKATKNPKKVEKRG